MPPSPPSQHADGLGRFTGISTVLLTLLGWSSVPLFLKHFSHLIDPWTSNGWRYGFSALLWAPVLLIGAWRATLPPHLWRLAIVPSLFNMMGQVCFTWAHYKINPGLLTFGLRTQIIFVAAGAALLFANERRVIRSPGFIAGVLMVLSGTALVILTGRDDITDGANAPGIALAIASGLLFACYALSVRKFMHGIAPLTAFACISQYTAAGMLILMVALGDRAGAAVLEFRADQLFWLFFSSFIGIALGHVCYYTAIARLGVAVSSGVIQLQPIIVSIASFALFDERLTLVQWLGGAVAIGGAAAILIVQQRAKSAESSLAASAE